MMYKYDKQFLEELMLQNNRKIFGRITVLSFNEQPAYSIEGLITGGSVNVDGESSVRRTCSLTMVMKKDEQINFGINNKFKLDIGISNMPDSPYQDDIIWFNQGIFIVIDYSLSIDETKITLNLTGKDKGCLLNGEMGGQFFAETKLDTLEIVDDNGNIQYKKLLIKDIIYNLLTEMNNENPANIILNDLDEYGYELLEYRGDKPLYTVYFWDEQWIPIYCTQDKPEGLTLIEDLNYNNSNSQGYTTLEIGELAGYHQTALIYPGDLIMKAGETVATALDKIKAMFPTYEYFYNLNGQFIFQRKPMYLNTTKNIQNLSHMILNNLQYEDIITNEKLITGLAPNIKTSDLKNDFGVWGTRENASGAAVPIHARIAIDKKPVSYKRITVTAEDIQRLRELYPEQYTENNYFYLWDDSELPREFTIDNYDWREIIYQMAMDYQRYHLLDNFYYRVKQANPQLIDGKTGYEQYYIDVLGFWRQLYDISPSGDFIVNNDILATEVYNDDQSYKYYFNILAENNQDIFEEYQKDDVQLEHPITAKKYECTKSNIKKYKLQYQPLTEDTIAARAHSFANSNNNTINTIKDGETQEEYVNRTLTIYDLNLSYNQENYWHKNVTENPTGLNFWLDFVEPNGEMEKFSVATIGQRVKVVNDKDVNVIILPDAPEIQYKLTTEVEKLQGNLALKLFQLPDYYYNLFAVASKQTSAIDKCNELLNQHTQLMSSITINTLPIYYLEPNKMFNFTFGSMTGKYVISKFSIPLSYNGTMSITANKVLIDEMEVGV